jgi:hypothetical protein
MAMLTTHDWVMESGPRSVGGLLGYSANLGYGHPDQVSRSG